MKHLTPRQRMEINRRKETVQLRKQTAVEAYILTMRDIEHQLNALRYEAANHFGQNPDCLNWGHVGDAKRISCHLQEVLDIIAGTNR